jgi:TolA-binding protein
VELFAGLAEMAQSDFAAASERFAAYIGKYSGSPYSDQVLLLLAQSCHQSGQAEAAIEHYRGVLKQKGGQYAAGGSGSGHIAASGQEIRGGGRTWANC